MDPLTREVQRVLDLVRPMLIDHEDGWKYNGYCGAATEAYLHLAGGRDSDLRVMRRANGDGTSHWWLEGERGVIDVIRSPSDRRWHGDDYPYEEGRPAMFRSGYDRPSKRAAAIIELVESRR